jgi:hypothetical protein
MKTHFLLNIAATIVLASAAMLFLNSNHTSAQDWQLRSVELRFEHYKMMIKDSFQIDIKEFKEKLKGGMADGKAITDYELEQLLEGIKWEREHTNDSFIALEIAMDHLERIPDYYNRLSRMERDAQSDQLLQR